MLLGDPATPCLTMHPLTEPLAKRLAAPPGDRVEIHWLGQAGFVLDGAGRRVVIDPYLSDCLAAKYRGTAFDHSRMMAAPVRPDQIGFVDLVLASHAHSDHCDPGTLPGLLAANPAARLVAPEACREVALARGSIGAERFVGLDAGRTYQAGPLRLAAVRAAHETLATDAAGHHLFLGYGIGLGRTVVFHSGDTVPFTGQVAEVAALGAALALLPVNGRRPELTAAGIAGNLTLSEAVALARDARIPAMIGHHFGMFAFNTLSGAEVEIDCAARAAGPLSVMAARVDRTYLLATDNNGTPARDE
ncbi:MBL fold metallo-hydrolase [Frigidibacter sp. MR17.14]|uniref:MBL fold metallo-hydrolase n=1 Tax=Frigidibacter sp. MR17.14 TaxID=3126509 RepID=UPI003012B24C